MKFLFVHQNFPGQFKHLAPALVENGHEVFALTIKEASPYVWQGVKVVPYNLHRGNSAGVHPWLLDMESKIIRAEPVSKIVTLYRANAKQFRCSCYVCRCYRAELVSEIS